MKRFDRAMYAFFLLALLGDVARVRVPVESGGGLVLQAAGQYRVEALGAASPGIRRAGVSFRPIVRLKSCSLSLLRWARSLSGQANLVELSGPAMLASATFGLGTGLCAFLVFFLPFSSSSLAIFEHSGSPAP